MSALGSLLPVWSQLTSFEPKVVRAIQTQAETRFTEAPNYAAALCVGAPRAPERV